MTATLDASTLGAVLGTHSTGRARSVAPAPAIRAATVDDASRLHELIADHRVEGHLLSRSLAELQAHATRFFVAHDGPAIVGCGELAPLAARGESPAWHRDRRGARPARREEGAYREYLTDEQRRGAGGIGGRMQRDFHHGLLGARTAEVRSLVVEAAFRGAGTGTGLVRAIIDRACARQFARLVAFTHDPVPFVRVGFSILPRLWVPEKIAADCVACERLRDCAQYALRLDLGPARTGATGA